jgi:tRNA (cmo5U34)-methyltransferase
MSKDEVYASDNADGRPFEFNEAVARVFPDMLRRSIPGYGATIEAIGALARRRVPAGTRCYDLGCSLGAAAFAMHDNIIEPGCSVIAVDRSPAMAERCRALIASRPGTDGPGISVLQRDIREVEIVEASMVVMNYTLQFLPVPERAGMLRRIAAGMIDGGVFVLSEKVIDADASVEALLFELHHDFKRRNAYSDLEISRKRAALENVLVPETLDTHLARFDEAGFRSAGVWLRYFNFVSLVALK